MLPSMPVSDLKTGRTRVTELLPVHPNTTNKTAASVGLSRQCGRGCVVQAQNRWLRVWGSGGEEQNVLGLEWGSPVRRKC
mmetsp:Transcript_71714/g.126589  ORF Transcript_71714/g.126589 Transcript_71714/m.126589 type:complete len:80 (+) Transcript_71714:145-384(+)